MNINDAFPSNYIKASDLGTAQPVVIIDRVEMEDIGRNKDRKPVVYFQGKSKGLVLNKTNSRKIAELAGSPDTDEWGGVRVRLYASETEFSGETVECIRIKAAGAAKPAPPRQPPPPPPPDEPDYSIPDEEIPF